MFLPLSLCFMLRSLRSESAQLQGSVLETHIELDQSFPGIISQCAWREPFDSY